LCESGTNCFTLHPTPQVDIALSATDPNGYTMNVTSGIANPPFAIRIPDPTKGADLVYGEKDGSALTTAQLVVTLAGSATTYQFNCKPGMCLTLNYQCAMKGQCQ